MKPNNSFVDQTKKKGTFQINPGEEDFVTQAKAGGLTPDQINRGLAVRRQDQQSGLYAEVNQPQPADLNGTPDPTQQDTAVDPFGGKSKDEVLKAAFLSGITNSTALKQIGDTYDMVTGGDKSPEEVKQENFSKAKLFITDNPQASKEELKAAILEHTKLDSTSTDALLNDSGSKNRKDLLAEDDLRKIAQGLVKDNTGLFTDSKKGKQSAIDAVNSDAELSTGEKAKVLQMIEEDYPNGRTLLDKLLPGGK
jgi:hypothetical protein